MEQVKQSLQETASKKRESYKSVFLKKRSVCNRQSVYISGEIQKRIVQIVGVITNKQVSIGNFIDNWKIQCKMPPKTKRFYPLVPK